MRDGDGGALFVESCFPAVNSALPGVEGGGTEEGVDDPVRLIGDTPKTNVFSLVDSPDVVAGVVEDVADGPVRVAETTPKTDAFSLVGSLDASPPLLRISPKDLVPDPAKDPNPPELAKELKALVAGRVGVATEGVTVPCEPLGVPSGIDDDPKVGAASGFARVVDAGGTSLDEKADTG